MILLIGLLIPTASGDVLQPEKTKIVTKSKGKTLYATLTTAKGKPIANKTIKFNVRGKTFYKKTNSKGTATLKIPSYSNTNNWKFKTTFNGDKKYKAVSKKGTIPKPTVTITCKPSCGRCSKAYTWRTKTYVNYCPNCHRFGTIYNKHKYAARHEQELTCGACDCDFCGNCGKEKMGYSSKYLPKP